MRSRPGLFLALAILACVLLVTFDAGAYQGASPCHDCSLPRPRTKSEQARNNRPAMAPSELPRHNFALIESERHSDCVRNLSALGGVVSELETLKAAPGLTSVRLPDLQKAFKRHSKAVGSNCF